MTLREMEQRLDWCGKQIYALQKRVEDLETWQCPHRYIDAVGKPYPTKEPTGETL